MKLEQQVCSLDLAKRLKESGVKQESMFLWALDVVDGWRLVLREVEEPDDKGVNNFAAFTVAELGEMLPKTVQRPSSGGDGDLFYLEYSDGGCTLRYVREFWKHGEGQEEYLRKGQKDAFASDNTEADARAKMLVYLLENKLIEV